MDTILFLFPILLLLMLPLWMQRRAQQKQLATLRQLQDSLHYDDAIITAGGLHGRVRRTDAETVDLEIAAGVVITVEKQVIIRRAEDATPESTPTDPVD